MGIKIMTDDRPVKVHRNDKGSKPSYYLTFWTREGDNWVNVFQPIRFRQGVEVHDGQEICIKHAFPTVDSWVKDGQQRVRQVWQIIEFTSDEPYTDSQIVNEARDTELPEEFSAVEDSMPF